MARPQRRRVAAAASFEPLTAVVLAVDQARTSGWALRQSLQVLAIGTTTTARQRHDACRLAIERSVSAQLPALLVLEDHEDTAKHALRRRNDEAPKANAKSILSLGAQAGRWRESWELAGGHHVVTVKPRVWRAAVLGKYPHAGRSEWKRLAQQWASATRRGLSEDEAEALAISHWAIFARESANPLLTNPSARK
jgi:hypothetical protein